jgi:ABC-type polysaccharide/polyol phosphate transport system ATPase subunit
MLKVIARVLRPTKGRVWVRGDIAPLIELGAGFHLELTGRENIFLNGAMLGYSQAQMEEKQQGIIEFAELDSFIDAPLRTYSSGMVMRLGFSIASDVDPAILIIDEILGVGDEAFRRKCLIFVSHALDAVQKLCDRAIWVEQGGIKHSGPADEVIDVYREHMAGKAPAARPA